MITVEQLQQIEQEREQREQDARDAVRYRKLRACTSISLYKEGVEEHVTLSNLQPERLDEVADKL